MKHELKIHPTHYQRVKDGTKTFEIRDNDRSFQKWDTVVLREWNPKDIVKRADHDMLDDYVVKGEYTNNPNLTFTIGDVYPIDDKRVVFSLIEVEYD